MADRPNLRHVAAVAGVSHMTVSRVLSGHPNIKESTRQKVLEAVDELNYRPNIAARSLVTQRTDRIGGEVGAFGMFLPGWGMHLSALQLAHGDMVRAVADIGRKVERR